MPSTPVGKTIKKQRSAIAIGVVNDDEIRSKLLGLPPEVFSKVIKSVTFLAMTPVVKDAKNNAPEQTGILKESLGKKRRVYKRAGTVVVLAGPRKGFKRKVGERRASLRQAWRSGQSTRDVYRDPAKYGHLPEKGFTTRSGGKVAGQRFIEIAFDRNRDNMETRMRKAIDRRIRKYWEKQGVKK